MKCAGQVAPVAQVTDDDVHAGVASRLGSVVVASDQPANAITAADEIARQPTRCGQRPW